jgi:hypothetical protein
MLMLIVVIIIAAIVSAFAGGTVSGVSKVPQATITAKFSASNGMEIDHGGGDSIPLASTVFTIFDGPTFGPNLNQKTAQVLNDTLITDISNNPVQNSQGGFNVTAFLPGSALFINGTMSGCQYLQPSINIANPGLCISNSTNIGKTFTLQVGDTHGNLISSTDVTIQP